jgi:hypothetical protein
MMLVYGLQRAGATPTDSDLLHLLGVSLKSDDSTHAQWFVYGEAAFSAIASSIEEAKSEVYFYSPKEVNCNLQIGLLMVMCLPFSLLSIFSAIFLLFVGIKFCAVKISGRCTFQ